MENLMREPTGSSPGIFFDPRRHLLEIRGSSYLENTLEFYEPILTWLHAYLSQLKQYDKLRVELELVYFNSSSSRALVEIFERLNEKAFHENLSVDVYWFYEAEDDDMDELGQDFQDDFRALIFHFTEISRHADGGI